MKVGDTVRLTSNFSSPGQDTIPQGTKARLCAINDMDRIATIDMGDSLPVVPITILEVISKAPEKTSDVLKIQTEQEKGLRYNEGKPKLHRVPYELLKAVAEGFEYGSSKYPDWNWTKPVEFSSPYNSLQRHLNDWWWNGEDLDKESQVHHLKLAATNIAMLLFHLENNPDMDDRRKK